MRAGWNLMVNPAPEREVWIEEFVNHACFKQYVLVNVLVFSVFGFMCAQKREEGLSVYGGCVFSCVSRETSERKGI